MKEKKGMVSVITPTHNPRFLDDLFKSLQGQTYSNWEWVLIPNGKLKPEELSKYAKDTRVKILPFEYGGGKVGALKRFGFLNSSGDYLLEMDHDDLLFPNALEKIEEAFRKNPDVCFVYSNCANVDVNNNWAPITWSERYGWSYREVEFEGRKLMEARSAPPTPHGLSRIWFAPNHLRAWRKDDYIKMGGHDQTMKISDDHDLICRSYIYGKIYHIDECLYVYRVYGDNTWLQNSEEIQVTMWQNYDRHIFPMIEKWSDESKLKKVDLCGGIDKPLGYTSLDIVNGDINCDLNEKWPIENDSVGVLRAYDAIEHLKDPIHTMEEAYRVLAHGGFFMIRVPSTDGRGAFQDPTHVSFWNENSFWYYTKSYVQRYIASKTNVRFQIIKLNTIFPSDWHRQNNIPYVEAHLVAIKQDQPRWYGDLEI